MSPLNRLSVIQCQTPLSCPLEKHHGGEQASDKGGKGTGQETSGNSRMSPDYEPRSAALSLHQYLRRRRLSLCSRKPAQLLVLLFASKCYRDLFTPLSSNYPIQVVLTIVVSIIVCNPNTCFRIILISGHISTVIYSVFIILEQIRRHTFKLDCWDEEDTCFWQWPLKADFEVGYLGLASILLHTLMFILSIVRLTLFSITGSYFSSWYSTTRVALTN